MTYFNFTKVTPASPNDPFVNVTTHLNNNWDEIDSKFTTLTGMPSTLTSPEQGQEIYDVVGNRFRVWNGTAWRDTDAIDSAWSAWSTLPLSANVIARPNVVLKWRNNTLLRRVELSGAVEKDVAQDPWSAGLILITTGTSGIPSTLQPIGGLTFFSGAAALPSVSGNGACGYHKIDVVGSWVRIQSQYVGGNGSGNFLQYDRVRWWY